MAIVPDLSGNFPVALPTGIDTRTSSVNRRNAGTPSGTLTPLFAGEIVQDTTANQLFMGTGTTNVDWTPVFLGA
jgi:hypothetical protein